MAENGDSVLKVVRLFIDNINESTKSTSKELTKVSSQLEEVKSKIYTPPRNEELSSQIQGVEDKADVITINLTTINNSVKTMITTVRAAAAVLAIAVLLAAGIMHYGKYIESKAIQKVEQKLDKYLDETKQIKSEVSASTDK